MHPHDISQEIYVQFFEDYGARTHLLADYLSSRSTYGFTPQQFDLYRTNYFYRTATTIEAVARAALSCALNNDRYSLACLGQNLYDETGRGHSSMNHQSLLENSHNLHAKVVFGLPEITIVKSSVSAIVTDETRDYRRIHQQLLSSGDHVTVLAASYAQEKAASNMLALFKSVFFASYRDRHTDQDYEVVSKYFSAHLDEGVEECHGIMAWNSLAQHLTTPAHRHRASEAIETFLHAQADVWDGLLQVLKEAEGEGAIVPVTSPWAKLRV